MKLHRQGAIIAANVRHKAALDACLLQDFRPRLGPCLKSNAHLLGDEGLPFGYPRGFLLRLFRRCFLRRFGLRWRVVWRAASLGEKEETSHYDQHRHPGNESDIPQLRPMMRKPLCPDT